MAAAEPKTERWSEAEIVKSVVDAASVLGYSNLGQQQKDAIVTFLKGRDVFVALPTGFGKSLCYGCLPLAFDYLQKTERKAIVIVISPLIALMKDQTSKFKDKALPAGFVSEGSSLEMKLGVLSGTFQLVFFSPEAILKPEEVGKSVKTRAIISELS